MTSQPWYVYCFGLIVLPCIRNLFRKGKQHAKESAALSVALSVRSLSGSARDSFLHGRKKAGTSLDFTDGRLVLRQSGRALP